MRCTSIQRAKWIEQNSPKIIGTNWWLTNIAGFKSTIIGCPVRNTWLNEIEVALKTINKSHFLDNQICKVRLWSVQLRSPFTSYIKKFCYTTRWNSIVILLSVSNWPEILQEKISNFTNSRVIIGLPFHFYQRVAKPMCSESKPMFPQFSPILLQKNVVNSYRLSLKPIKYPVTRVAL